MSARKPDTQKKTDAATAEIVATAFLHSLFQFLRLTEIHKQDNKIFDEAVVGLLRTIENFLSLSEEGSGLYLTFRGEHIFVNRTRLRPRPRQFYVYRFILKFMRLRRIGTFVVHSIPTPEEARYFLLFMSQSVTSPEGMHPVDHISAEAKNRGFKAFEVKALAKLQVGTGRGESGEEGGLDDVELAAALVYDELRKFAGLCFENLENASKFQPRALRDLMSDLSLLSEEDLVQMLRLLSLKRYDRPWPYRAVNSCFLMAAWAFSLRLPRGVVLELAGLALAHPLAFGENGEPPSSTNAPERFLVLDKIERLKDVWPINELQSLALLEYGLPFGSDGIYDLNGTRCYMHFFSRMLRIVADFEMLTTYEPPRRVFLPDEALTELLSRRDMYDQTLLKLFINWLGVYPVGTLVSLQTGEIAQVFAGSSDPTKFQRPMVMILKDSKGNLLSRPELYDLTEMNEKLGTYKKSIRRSMTVEESGIPPEHFKMTPAGI